MANTSTLTLTLRDAARVIWTTGTATRAITALFNPNNVENTRVRVDSWEVEMPLQVDYSGKINANFSLFGTSFTAPFKVSTGTQTVKVSSSTSMIVDFTNKVECSIDFDVADSGKPSRIVWWYQTTPISLKINYTPLCDRLIKPTITFSDSPAISGTDYIISWQDCSVDGNKVASYTITEGIDTYWATPITTTDTAITFNHLVKDDATYKYKIVANSSFEGNFSSQEASATLKVISVTEIGDITPIAPAIGEGSVNVSWSAAKDGKHNPVIGYTAAYQDSPDGINWGDITEITPTIEECAFTYGVNPVRGAYRRFIVNTIGTIKGYDLKSAYTNIIQTNRLPETPFINSGGTTYNSTPYIVLEVAEDEDKQDLTAYVSINGADYEELSSLTVGTNKLRLPQIQTGTNTIAVKYNDGLAYGEASTVSVNLASATYDNDDLVRASHINNSRSYINVLRQYYSLRPILWGNAISAGDRVSAADWKGLQQTLVFTGVSFTEVKSGDAISKTVFNEIKNAIREG